MRANSSRSLFLLCLRRVGASRRFRGAYEVTRVTSHRLSPPPSERSGIPLRKPVVADGQFRRSGGFRAAVPQHWATGRRRLCVHTRALFPPAVPLLLVPVHPSVFREPFVRARPDGRTELHRRQSAAKPAITARVFSAVPRRRSRPHGRLPRFSWPSGCVHAFVRSCAKVVFGPTLRFYFCSSSSHREPVLPGTPRPTSRATLRWRIWTPC